MAALLGLVLACPVFLGLAPGKALGAALHPTLLAQVSYGSTPPAFARTTDGTLHVAFASNINWGDSANGVGAVSISPSGHVLPAVQALAWPGPGGSPSGIPGLAVSNGALEATFGGSPGGDDGPWGISSTDGGATWSVPVNIGSGSMAFGDSHVDIAYSGATPVLTAGCCGGIVIQQGFGPGAPTSQLTNSADGDAGNTDSTVDAATGAVIDSWDSIGSASGLYLQQVAPTLGAPVRLAVPSQYGTGVPVILAGRDSGPGVFAAYPANYGQTTHIRLYRYGAGTIPVGSVPSLHADVWGATTGPDGRIWVTWWGQDAKTGKFELALTRSNKELTAFEPIQVFGLGYSYLYSLSGDGRLGPLDLLIVGTPDSPNAAAGIYYSRLLPELSAAVSTTAVKNKSGQVVSYKFKVAVTDAGDPVSGAQVSGGAGTATTNGKGIAHLKSAGQPGGQKTFTITAPGYRQLTVTVPLS